MNSYLKYLYGLVLFLGLFVSLRSTQAATITSAQTGNWNATSTWVGGVIPGSGDTVILANGFTVTIPSSYHAYVGTSPVSTSTTIALQCSSDSGTGGLVIAGTLTFRGPVVQCNSSWSVSAGGILEHDSSLAATPLSTNYTWLIGNNDLSSNPPFLALNGSSGSHAIVRIASGSGNAGGFSYGPTLNYDGGLLHATYTDISDWGTSSIALNNLNLSSGAVSTGQWYCDNCTIIRSGMIAGGNIAGGATVRLNGTLIKNSLAGFVVDFENGVSVLSTGQRLIQNSVIEGTIKFYCGASSVNCGFSFVNSWINGFYNAGDNSCALWDGILLNNNATGTGNPTQPCYGSSDYTYVLRSRYSGNPHYITFDAFGSATAASHMVGDPVMIVLTGPGDFIQVQSQPTSPQTLTITNSLLLPDPSGASGGSFINVDPVGTPTNLTVVADNNTFTNDGTSNGSGGVTGAVGIGGENANFQTGLFSSVRNNLSYCSTGCPTGYLLTHYSGGSVASGTVTTADYNNAYNLSPSYYLGGLVSGSYASTPGTHDKQLNPNFSDTNRRLATFSQSYFGVATSTEWSTYAGSNVFNVGDVVSHVLTGSYGNKAINYRAIATSTNLTAGSEPTNGSVWTNYWELASMQTIRDNILAGTTYTDTSIGASSDGIVKTLIKWTQQGWSTTNAGLKGAGYNSTDIGCCSSISTIPDAPTSPSAVAGNGQATVSFTAPVSNGGSAILYYTASSTPGNITATSSSTSIVVSGLTNGVAYTFKVTATNAVGTSTVSTATSAVTPLASAPIISSISSGSPGRTSAVITWITNVLADSQVEYGLSSSYTASTTLDTNLVTSHLVNISGLTASTLYHFRVESSNGTVVTSTDQTFTTAPNAPVSTSASGGSGSPAPSPSIPEGGFTATIGSASSNGKNILYFNFGNDIKKIAISDNITFTPALYIDATSSIAGITAKNIYVKYCNQYSVCSSPISVRTDSSVSVPSIPSAYVFTYVFNRNLAYPMRDSEVKELQKYLNTSGFTVTETGGGSPGNETNYFGMLTYKAIIKFQEAHASEILTPSGLKKGTGYFGPSTRAFVNK